MSKAENRHHRERMKKRGMGISKITYGLLKDEQWVAYRERESRRFIKTRKPCSCFMLGCGNKRNHEHGKAALTAKELLAALRQREQMNELNEEAA